MEERDESEKRKQGCRKRLEGSFFSSLDLEGGKWLAQVVRGSRQGEEDLVDNPSIRASRNSDGNEGLTQVRPARGREICRKAPVKGETSSVLNERKTPTSALTLD